MLLVRPLFLIEEVIGMRVAISSDNHVDSNQVDVDEIVAQQAEYLRIHNVDMYFIAGDVTNDFQKTVDYVEKLTALTTAEVRFIAGNHDMLHNVTYTELESNLHPQYFHRQQLRLPNWTIIGNNGWYDYSFSQYYTQPASVARWKKALWVDSPLQQPGSDWERMDRVLAQIKQALDQVQTPNVLVITHFVPHRQLLWPKPARVKTARYERIYEMVVAMMGSQRLGDLLASYPQVKDVIYGHIHGVHPPQVYDGITYLNPAVGVNKPHNQEWQWPNFMQQWQHQLVVLDLA